MKEAEASHDATIKVLDTIRQTCGAHNVVTNKYTTDGHLELKPGQVLAVFNDRTGFLILKAEEVRPERAQPLAEVQRQIAKEQLAAKKASEVAKKKAEDTLAKVKADQQTFPTLKHAIEQLKASGRPTADLESGLWHKLSKPLSVILGLSGRNLPPKLGLGQDE